MTKSCPAWRCRQSKLFNLHCFKCKSEDSPLCNLKMECVNCGNKICKNYNEKEGN